MTTPHFLSSTPQHPLLASPSAAPAATAQRFLELRPDWPLARGGALSQGRLAFELCGPAGAPVVAVQGGISAGSHVTAATEDPRPGWWQAIVGPGRAVDTLRFRVLSFDFLGGNGASSGPRCCPAGSAPESFPAIDTADQARALADLLDALEIPRLHAFVGASYGGMVGLALAARHPDRVGRLAVVSAAHRSHPQSTAWRSLQRKIVRLGLRSNAAREGLALSRGLAMTTYRSPAELAQRFDGDPSPGENGFRFPVEDYLEARGADFAERFDAHAFLRLSESIDLHRVDPARISTPARLVAVRSDQLVPVGQMRELAAGLGGPAGLVEIDSLYGHDAFLKEVDTLGATLAGCLQEGRV